MTVLICLFWICVGIFLNVSTFLLGYGFGISKKIVDSVDKKSTVNSRSGDYWHTPVPFERN
jgi:hypothetical protein